jgi:hypothetical protein
VNHVAAHLVEALIERVETSIVLVQLRRHGIDLRPDFPQLDQDQILRLVDYRAPSSSKRTKIVQISFAAKPELYRLPRKLSASAPQAQRIWRVQPALLS